MAAPPSIFAEDIGEDAVYLVVCGRRARRKAREIGARRMLLLNRWRIRFRSRQEEMSVLQRLRDAEVPLLGPNAPGWPPAAVFLHYRDQGELRGDIKAFVFTGPGKTTELQMY